MEKHYFNYSMKNIPIPSKKQYLKYLTEKVELLIKRMRWKTLMSENNLIKNLFIITISNQENPHRSIPIS